MTAAARYGAVYALLRAAADLGDHWVQTHGQACRKAAPGRAGHAALAGHVVTYVATQGAALALGNRLLGLGLRPGRVAAALALSGATHYVIDRRWPLERLSAAIGKQGFYDLGADTLHTADGVTGAHLGRGSYAMDQAAHHAVEAVAALIAARS
ncbi:transcriptional regulator [Streptomyces sp. BI20]|uniref:transcriptional regulator n=1 Tax=Streptomyces sp. BI20 TaxID=3403460 RepID=UPI003C76A525